MATEKETLILDLDSKPAVKSVNDLSAKLIGLGDPKNFTQLITGLTKITRAVAVVGSAVVALKVGLDTILEAEATNKINAQFETLAKNAGLAADVLANELVGATQGLVDDTEVIKAANEALAQMGTNATRLPELMQLATKQVEVFGGDVLTRFKEMSKAIEGGTLDVLKNVGITTKAKDAIQAYAKSVGKMTFEIGEAEKRQALLNAVITEGNKKTAGITVNTNRVTEQMQMLKVTLLKIGEVFTLAFERLAGPALRSVLKYVNELATTLKQRVFQYLGDDAQKASAKLFFLRDELKKNEETLASLEAKIKADTYTRMFSGVPAQAAAVRAEIEKIKSEITALESAAPKPKEEPKTKPDTTADENALAARAKFYESLQALRLKDIEAQMLTATSEEEVLQLSEERKGLIIQDFFAKVEALRANARANNIADEDLAVQIAAAESERNAKLAQEVETVTEKQRAALLRFGRTAKETTAGFRAGFKQASKSSQKDLSATFQFGQMGFALLTKGAQMGFAAIGQAAAGGALDMKKAMIGAIGEIAEAKGAEIVADGIATLNPLKIAGGGALITLGSFLKSKAGAMGGGVPVPTGGGAAASEIRPEQMEIPEAKTEVIEQSKKTRDVTVNIMGHYMETPETRRTLTELLRQESDATQFTISQIGQGA